MALAGNMKLKNFVVLALLVAGAGIGGAYWACSGKHEKKHDHEKEEERKKEVADQVKQREAPPPDAAVAPDAAAATTGDLAARPYDAEVIAWKDKTIPGDKLKDASKGKSYKLDVYKDAGHAKVNRVKVDLDRDGKFDEKFTFDGDKIVMQRAPVDDEKYSEEYKWTGAGWLKQQPQLEKKP